MPSTLINSNYPAIIPDNSTTKPVKGVVYYQPTPQIVAPPYEYPNSTAIRYLTRTPIVTSTISDITDATLADTYQYVTLLTVSSDCLFKAWSLFWNLITANGAGGQFYMAHLRLDINRGGSSVWTTYLGISPVNWSNVAGATMVGTGHAEGYGGDIPLMEGDVIRLALRGWWANQGITLRIGGSASLQPYR